MKKKRNILYIIDKLTVGGAQQHLVRLVLNLPPEKYNVEVCCLLFKGELASLLEQKNINVFELGLKKIYSCSAIAKFFTLRKYIDSKQFDIVQTYLFSANIFGVMAARLTNCKNIISCRRDLGFWRKTRHTSMLKFTNNFANFVLANSHAVKDSVVKQENQPEHLVKIVYNGCEMPKIKPKVKTNPAIGIVANLREVKDHATFLMAAEIVLQKNPQCKFHIYGEGALKEKLQQMVNEMNIQNNVIFKGSTTPEKAYPEIDISVLCSTSEGFSNTIIESMAYGLPVIATNVGGNSEAIENNVNGFLIQPGDHKALAEKIIYLLDNPDRLEIMGKKSRVIAEKLFSIPAMIQQMENVYDELLPEGKDNEQ